MKSILKISIQVWILGILFVATSCLENDDLITAGAKEGGLVKTTTGSLNYVVGNPGPYTVQFIVPKTAAGASAVTQINLYKRFETNPVHTEEIDGEEVEVTEHFVSNEVLAKTIDVAESDAQQTLSESFMYDELIDGLEVEKLDGSTGPLPEDDGELLIGDKWVFRVETVLADGTTLNQGYSISAGVSTRYAGQYKCVFCEYYRLGVLTYTTNDWPAATTIESVDATTYKVVDYLGAFANSSTPPEWFFQINGGVITYPDETPSGDPQTGNGQPFIDCESNAADMPEVHCDDSNYVINNDETGKDRLVMSFGYFTPGSGPRVFYQIMEKIVE